MYMCVSIWLGGSDCLARARRVVGRPSASCDSLGRFRDQCFGVLGLRSLMRPFTAVQYVLFAYACRCAYIRACMRIGHMCVLVCTQVYAGI